MEGKLTFFSLNFCQRTTVLNEGVHDVLIISIKLLTFAS